MGDLRPDDVEPTLTTTPRHSPAAYIHGKPMTPALANADAVPEPCAETRSWAGRLLNAPSIEGGSLPFLSGGGIMGALMRDHDWSSTPLGVPGTWPQSFRSTMSVCLNSPVLGAILWGPDLLMLYNDAYIPSMADRHPAALGRPVAEVWGSAWDQVSPPFHRAMETGKGFSQTGVVLPMVRRGLPETTHWNFSASAIQGEDGSIVGLFNQGFGFTD